uniref:Cell surface receptor IPT/TIG domain-containing protein n=1 Tax=uncultured bacterium contig00010(2014) TaxID=1465626 RepID=A0A060D227_9BACT|nr:cell surface receptor IPT/TIG domain-containing protein [uncultured bacterium contig00010(2014)]
MLAAALTVGCTNSDEGDGVTLKAFGPSPVLRGGTIRFIGSNIDRVTEVVFPEGVSVTEITRVNSGEITAIVPQEATVGRVKLIFPGGEITTASQIGFSEPFSISSLAPLTLVREGDVVTIAGDYLNNIVKVVFTGNVAVEQADFVSQSRAKIELKVPAAATSGKIYVEDAAGNQLYSDDELSIHQPTVATVTTTAVRPGDVISLGGEYLDLVEKVIFTGGAEVAKADFVSQSASMIKVTVPFTAQDGGVTIVAASGQEVESAPITIVVPAELLITADSRFKAGLGITISGSNLDLVTDLAFTGAEATFVYANGNITTTIPMTAIDGEITLTTSSTKTVTTEALTLVRPVITSFAPTAIIAGEEVTITGEDLDLVTSAKVGGNAALIGSRTATEMVITTALSAPSGVIALTLENGVVVESADALDVTPSTKPTVSSMPAKAMPGDEITLTGTNLNYVEAVYFGDVKVTTYSIRSKTELTFTIPMDAPTAAQKIKLVATNGDVIWTDDEISLSMTDPVTEDSIIMIDFEHADNRTWAWNIGCSFENDNSWYIRYNGTVDGTGGSKWIINQQTHSASMPPYQDIVGAENYWFKMDIKIENDIPVISTGNNAQFVPGWFWVSDWLPLNEAGTHYSTGGAWITLTMNFSGNITLTSGDLGWAWAGGEIDLTGVCLDNLRFEPK